MYKLIATIFALLVVGMLGYFYGTMNRDNTIKYEYVGECARYMHEVVCNDQVYVIPIPDGEDLEMYAVEYCSYLETLE